MVKEVTVTCQFEGADNGKRFKIARMSAFEADRWGRHCLQAAAASGGNIAGVTAGGGLAAVAAAGIGIFAAMEPSRMDELIARLMQQVFYISPAPNMPPIEWDIAKDQIEEVETIGWLQSEAFKLHTGFFKGVGPLFSLISLMLGAENEGPTPAAAT